eukprot:362475-Chlamydomonas_euryale.AAC.3
MHSFSAGSHPGERSLQNVFLEVAHTTGPPTDLYVYAERVRRCSWTQSRPATPSPAALVKMASTGSIVEVSDEG